MISRIKYVLLVLSLVSLCNIYAQQDLSEQRMKILMREIGHEFLLQMNDSVSRVLPIENEEGRYRIQFEKYMDFEPDLMHFAAVKVFETNEIEIDYILEIEQCDSGNVVYSYEYNPSDTEAVVACMSRPLPKDCYGFYFTIIEEEQAAASMPPPAGSVNTGLELFIMLGVAIALVILVIVILKSKKKTNAAHQIRIGNYTFDKNSLKLILDEQIEELSSKEADLLELLVANANQTLEREHILKVVWKDEGDYVGRTLDVSISKLRKKLQGDERIQIINSRGVGYRFVIED